MLRNVIAVDPGGRTGVAWIGDDGRPRSCTIDDPMYAVHFVHEWQPPIIICENFTPRGGARTWQPDALHIIGALRYIAWLRDLPFVLQSPADAKRFATDDKLRRIGWHKPGHDHENDARRHLLLGLTRAGEIDVEKLLEEDSDA